MRHLCCDQPEILTRSYYSRVDSMAINAATRLRIDAPVKETLQNKQYYSLSL